MEGDRRDRGRPSGHGDTYVTYGDTYVSEQIGLMGRHVRARDVPVTGVQYTIDLPALAEELAGLKQNLLADAAGPEDYIAIGEVGHAEEAALGADEFKVRSHVARAGTFLWDTATKVGADLAASYSESARGL